jgi:8-oxo-dGTP pyrophosphatase MutT (NUDIX family)
MKTFNQLLAFLLELVMIAAWALKGLALPLLPPLPVVAAVAIPLAVIAVWGLLAAPRARFPLPLAGTVSLKAVLLLGGAAALASIGQPAWAAADALLIVVNLGLAVAWQQLGRTTSAGLRASLAALLRDYALRFPDEGEVHRQFSSFLASGETLQGKSNPRRHITASAWIVNPARTRVLLTHHAKLDKWVQLGGHTDEGEDWTAAALREAREESGLDNLRLVEPGLFDLDVHTIPARGEAPAHDHYDLRFLVEADDAVPLIVSEESRALAWVDLTELARYTGEESQHRMARKTVPYLPS